MPEESNELAVLLRQRREEKGLSQADLAARAGLSHSIVYRAETGASTPSRSTLSKLAEALEMPVNTLFAMGERARAGGGTDQLRVGIPHSIWATPLISLLFNFTGPFRLLGAHFAEQQGEETWQPVIQARQGARRCESNDQPYDAFSLMEALVAQSLDCAWIPRSTYETHYESLTRYATLVVRAPPSDLLLVRDPSAQPITSIEKLGTVPHIACFVAGESGEAEYDMLACKPKNEIAPLRVSAATLLREIQQARERFTYVLCLVSEPLTTLIKQRCDILHIKADILTRTASAYRLEALWQWPGICYDFVFPREARVPGNWIKAYVRALKMHAGLVSSQHALERSANCLGLTTKALAAALGQRDGGFQVWLDLESLALATA